jgi:hypothetical protein
MLTTAQLSQLKAAIIADANLATAYDKKDVGFMVNYLKGNSTFVVWRDSTLTSDIFDAIVGSNLTPSDAPDGTQLFENRAMVCQGKQNSLMILLQGQLQLSTGKSNIRVWLQDALTGLPSGASGAVTNAGWPAVKTAISRFATLYEKIFSTGTGTAGTPGSLVVEGSPVLAEVAGALYNDDGTPK